MKNSIMVIALLASTVFTACGSAEQNNTTNSTSSTSEVTQETPKVQNIDQNEFKTMMNDSNVVIIDVRTADEVSQGYIKGADYFIDINRSDFAEKINELDKDKTYLMYCRSGGRSGRASEFMVQNGFTTVYNLQGGITSYSGEISK